MGMEALTEEIRSLKADLAEDRRRPLVAEVAKAKGLTDRQAKRLEGSTRAELEADADELLAMVGETGGETGGGGQPKEKLRPGPAADDQDHGDLDAHEVAEAVMSGRARLDPETEKVVDRIRRGF